MEAAVSHNQVTDVSLVNQPTACHGGMTSCWQQCPCFHKMGSVLLAQKQQTGQQTMYMNIDDTIIYSKYCKHKVDLYKIRLPTTKIMCNQLISLLNHLFGVMSPDTNKKEGPGGLSQKKDGRTGQTGKNLNIQTIKQK